MPRHVDLCGQRFGRLTVIEKADPWVSPTNGSTKGQWRCKCDCGSEVLVVTSRLRNGTTKSCGCLSKEKAAERMRDRRPPIKNISGQRFGRLTVIKLAPRNLWGNASSSYWVCQCDCGNTTITSANSLNTGKTRSCGCLLDEARRAVSPKQQDYYKEKIESHIGEQFEHLTIMGVSGDEYVCQCDCGNTINIKKGNWKRRKSCGCIPYPLCTNSLVGQTFGYLTVVKELERVKGRGRIYECMCKCGNKITASHYNLARGAVLSCGCLRKGRARQAYFLNTGLLPDNKSIVTSIDGNRANYNTENLIAVPKSVPARVKNNGICPDDGGLYKTAIMAYSLSTIAKRVKRENQV